MFRRISLLLISLIGLWLLPTAASAQEPITPRHSDPVWQAWYWNNTGLSGPPVLQRSETNLDYTWGTGSPDHRINVDGFSARWTRYIDVPAGTYRFTATSDDGVRVWVDDNLIINEWYDHGAITVSAEKKLSAGHHLVEVEYYENGGEALVKVTAEPVSSTPIYNWRGEYFNNTGLSGSPALVRDDGQIDFNWGTGSPAPGLVGTDGFSVRWTRTLNLPAGFYRFYATADDGVRVWVNNHLLIDAWRDQSATAYTGDIYLPGGTIPVRMEYYENRGDAVAKLRWQAGNVPPPEPPPSANGWRGEYFANRDLAGSPAFTRIDPELRFNWGTGSPAPGFPADDFSVRWTREIYLAGGLYTSYARHDDGVRLWIDDQLVIDAWYDQSATTHSTTNWLSEGRHRLKVEYYEHTGTASLSAWAQRGQTESPTSYRSEIIVDNMDAGFYWGGPSRGRQNASYGYGDQLNWTYNSTTRPVNYGKWIPNLPASGSYEVFAYIPGDYGSSARVRYRILHDNQRHDCLINQGRYSDEWVSLGTYHFAASQTGREFVLVYDNTGEPYASGTIAFDAIKFVPR